jgi:tRNA-specific 2-thiouridylase
MVKNHKNPERSEGTVFVGLSGGVDSAVSAAILKKQGYEVVGVFIRTWHPDFLECNEEEERHDAMRVAAYLDIPFLTFDFEDVYKKEVADYMIAEYKSGRTPNPDVMCNKEVKFGAFLKKALSMGADFVATGHYANIRNEVSVFSSLRPFLDYEVGTLGKLKNRNFISYLEKSPDPSKDQSYFLWTLRQEQIKRIIFPVGGLHKTEVRKLAKKFKLPVASKKDSQGICFLGAVDLKDFLKHYIKSKKGKVLNEKGEEIGFHDGVVFYTLGERHGFTITMKKPNDGPYYVVGKDIKKNTLLVSQNKNLKNITNTNSNKINLEKTNWISVMPDSKKKYSAQIRYHGELLSCHVNALPKDKAEILLDKSVLVASGQSCVLYDGEVCLGGGVVA